MPSIRDRAFQLFWRLQRPVTLGVRAVVDDESGRVLLVRHTYTPGWHSPGGGVEKNETAAMALRRELKEEARIKVTGEPALVSAHSNHHNFPNDHILVFRVHDWEAEDFSPTREIAEIVFANPMAPPDGTTGGTRRRLEEIFAAKPPSEAW